MKTFAITLSDSTYGTRFTNYVEAETGNDAVIAYRTQVAARHGLSVRSLALVSAQAVTVVRNNA